MKLVKSTLWALGLGFAVVFAATPAQAKGSVHIDLPGFSIGYYDDHYGSSRHYNRKYRHGKYYRDKYHHGKYDDRYRYDRTHRSRSYTRSHSKGYYNKRYDDRYYNQPYSRSYDRSYRQSNVICPQQGYSRYRIERRYCTPHKDHYHCE